MKPKPTRTQLTRRATANKRRADVIAKGGRTLQLLLDPIAAQALKERMERSKQTALDVVRSLLLG